MSNKIDQGSCLYRILNESQNKLTTKNAPPCRSKELRMTETRIYIGLNDAQTNEQIYETDMYMNVLKYVCRNYHVAFSVNIENGGYFHDDGEYTEETSFVLVLINADRRVVDEIAKDLCSFFHQESVLVTENSINGYFTGGNF